MTPQRNPLPINPYATDGICHNANWGTFGHECGRPADWLGIARPGFGISMGFCDHCRAHGDERYGFACFIIYPR